MIITMLSIKDFSASGWKVCQAIKQYTDHSIELFVQRHNYALGHPCGDLVNDKNRKKIQERIDVSDIVHIKGDWPATKRYMGFRIDHKPIVQTVSGGLFRKKQHGGYEKLKPEHYTLAALKTSFTPDLCYPGYSDLWTPHPINSERVVPLWERRDPPVLAHAVVNNSRRSVKGTNFIIDVINRVKLSMDCKMKIISGMRHDEAVEMKKDSTIFFDQMRVGFYGNSAIEAMQYGIPVCAWIAPWARERSKVLEECPVISMEDKDPAMWADMIYRVLQYEMRELSEKTKEWCDSVHGYKAVAKQWDDLYSLLML